MSALSYIFYKIKGTKLPAYDTVSFEGLNISTSELKKAIMTKKKMGMSTEVELLVEDEQSGKEYRDDDLIPKLKKVVVSRRVIGNVRALEPGQQEAHKLLVPPDPDEYEKKKAHDAAEAAAKVKAAEASEAQNIFAAIAQSAQALDPSKYMNMPKARYPHHQQQYCFRCGKPGHLSAECLSGLPGKPPKPDYSDIQVNDIRLIKKATGIPNSELMPVDGPHYKGTVMTKSGQYAVPKIDARVHNEAQRRREPAGSQSAEAKANAAREPVTVPPELKCGLCNDLLRDAVLTLCCNESFCDDCIRDALLSSDEHLCPKCQKPCAPASLVPNLNIRNFVRSFANENNYTPLKLQAKSAPQPQVAEVAQLNENERSTPPVQVKDADAGRHFQSHRQSPPTPEQSSNSSLPQMQQHQQQQQQQQQQIQQHQQQPGITVLMMPQQFPGNMGNIGNFMMRPPFMNNMQFHQPNAGLFAPAFHQPAQMAMMQAFINQLRPIMAQHQFNEQQQQQFLETQIRQFQEQMAQQQQQQQQQHLGMAPVAPVEQPVVEAPQEPSLAPEASASLSSVAPNLPPPAVAQPFLSNLTQQPPSALVAGLAVRAAAAAAPFMNQGAVRPGQSFAEQLTSLLGAGALSGAGSQSDTAAIERFLKRDVFPRRYDRNRRRSRSRSPRRRSRSRNRSRSRSRSPGNRNRGQRRSRSRSPPQHRGRSDRDRDSRRDRDRSPAANKSSSSSATKSQPKSGAVASQIANALTALRAAGLNAPAAQLQPGALGKLSRRECEKMMDEWFEKVRAMHGENVEKLYRTAYQPYIDALLSGAEKGSPSSKDDNGPSPSKDKRERESSEGRGAEKASGSKEEPVSSTVADGSKAEGKKDLPETFAVVDEVSSTAKAEAAAAGVDLGSDGQEKSQKKKKRSVSEEEDAEEKKKKKKEKKEKKHKKEGEKQDDEEDKEKDKKKKKHKEKSAEGENGTEEDEEKRREQKRLKKEAKEARRREKAEKKERKLLKKQQKEADVTADRAKSGDRSRSREKFSSRDRNDDRSRSRSREKFVRDRNDNKSRSRSRDRYASSRDRNENRSRSRSKEKFSSGRDKEKPTGVLESYVVPASYPAIRVNSSPSRQRHGGGQQSGGGRRIGGKY